MNEPAKEPAEPTTPFPPRFWWLKRLIVLSIVLVVGFILIMKWWAAEAHRRLQAEIDAIHARGEPILIKDFDFDPIPDELNAAVSLDMAASKTALPTGAQAFLDTVYNRDRAVDEPTLKMMASIAQASATPRQLARLARFQPQVDWGIRFKSPAMNVLLRNLSPQRRLASLLTMNAHYEHLAGHDAEAIEIIRDLLRQSDAIGQEIPVLVTHLVALIANADASQTARQISYDLSILPDSASTTAPSTPASRQQVLALIGELLDDRAYRRGWIDAMHGERTMEFDAATTLAGRMAAIQLPPALNVLQPMFELDAIHMMRTMSTVAAAGNARDYPTAKSGMPDLDRMHSNITYVTRIARLMTMAMLPSLNRTLETHHRGLTERRAAAIFLAIRLYQLDHAGSLPAKLADLVPQYLPDLPADPFATDGRTFGYRATPEPIFYSVGVNGKDEGGDPSLPPNAPPTVTQAPPGHPADGIAWRRADMIFSLQKPQPLPAASPTTNGS